MLENKEQQQLQNTNKHQNHKKRVYRFGKVDHYLAIEGEERAVELWK